MPRARPPQNQEQPACSHQTAYTDVSPHAKEVSFKRETRQKRLAAMNRSGTILKSQSLDDLPSPASFPAPLVLPGDDLASEDWEEGDGMRAFSQLDVRNKVTPARRTVYVFESPRVTDEVSFMRRWLEPGLPDVMEVSEPTTPPVPVPSHLARPSVEDVADYLRAFYHDMEVKVVRDHFRYVRWDEKPARGGRSGSRGKARDTQTTAAAPRIGVASPSGVATRIRYQASQDGVTEVQLSLYDLLDALDDALPPDSFASLLLVDHDTYESPKDDFCCGRAFGSSRIAAVSSFRYNPALDDYAGIDLAHTWPASHCQAYVDGQCGIKRFNPSKVGLVKLDHDDGDDDEPSPLAAALVAARDVMVPPPSNKAAWEGLWLGRVCRTASHEVGHEMGIGHCPWYACVMQGTGSVVEDGRQPPYLCPIDLAKMSFAIAGEPEIKGRKGAAADRARKEKESAWVRGSYRAVLNFCARYPDVGMFRGYAAWLQRRLRELGETEEDEDGNENKNEKEGDGAED